MAIPMTRADEVAFATEQIHMGDEYVPGMSTEMLNTFSLQMEIQLQIQERKVREQRAALKEIQEKYPDADLAIFTDDLDDTEMLNEEYRKVLVLIQKTLDERNA